MTRLHREILAPGQAQALAASAEVLAETGAVIAGGLALALRFGHRRSQDMDWFLPTHAAADQLPATLADLPEVQLVRAEPGTIHGDWAGTPFSIISYRYRLAYETIDGLPLADIRTSASMKLLAALNRGARRDLIDIAECLEHGADLMQLLEQAVADIPGLTIESLLRALSYYEDAEKDPDPEGLGANGWSQAKQRLAVAIRSCL